MQVTHVSLIFYLYVNIKFYSNEIIGSIQRQWQMFVKSSKKNQKISEGKLDDKIFLMFFKLLNARER